MSRSNYIAYINNRTWKHCDCLDDAIRWLSQHETEFSRDIYMKVGAVEDFLSEEEVLKDE